MITAIIDKPYPPPWLYSFEFRSQNSDQKSIERANTARLRNQSTSTKYNEEARGVLARVAHILCQTTS